MEEACLVPQGKQAEQLIAVDPVKHLPQPLGDIKLNMTG
jgi:hypothetical protein